MLGYGSIKQEEPDREPETVPEVKQYDDLALILKKLGYQPDPPKNNCCCSIM